MLMKFMQFKGQYLKSTRHWGRDFLKAAKQLLPEHSAQLYNYLRATDMKLGLLVNFSHYPGVEIKRIAL